MGASLVASVGKESACNAGDPSSIPVLGRSPREGNCNPLQYSCLKNSMDRGAWQVTGYMALQESDTNLVTKPPQTFKVIRLVKEDSMVKNV